MFAFIDTAPADQLRWAEQALALPPFRLWLPADFTPVYGRLSALHDGLRARVAGVPVARGVLAAVGVGAHGPVVVHATLAGNPGLFDDAGAARAVRALTHRAWWRPAVWRVAGPVQRFTVGTETALRVPLAPRAAGAGTAWVGVGALLPAGLAMAVVQYACASADLDTWAPRFADWAARTQGVSRDLGSRTGALGYERALARAARRTAGVAG
jgi:hypothetical protein